MTVGEVGALFEAGTELSDASELAYDLPLTRYPDESRDPDLQQVSGLKAWAPTFVGVTD